MAEPEPDLLSDVLAMLQLRTVVLSTFHLTSPWGLDVPAFGPSFVYAVIEGRAHVELEGEPAFVAEAGDLFVLPGGDAIRVKSEPQASATPILDIFQSGQDVWAPGKRLGAPLVTHYGGGGTKTELLTMLMDFSESDRAPIRLNLPRLIRLRHAEHKVSPLLASTVKSIVEEARGGQIGYWALATRLAELVFINAIRTHLLHHPEASSGWLRGASDARIARALVAIHHAPEEAWNIQRLSSVAGMSRSSFASRFHVLMGQTPIDYLTNWRMKLAREALTQGRWSVKAAASAVGYASEKSFSQAFHRVIGMPPSSFRKSGRHP